MKSASEDFQYISIAPLPKLSGTLKNVKQKLTKLGVLLTAVVSERDEPEEFGASLQMILDEVGPVLENGDDLGLVDSYLSLILSSGVLAGLVGALGAVDADGWSVLSARYGDHIATAAFLIMLKLIPTLKHARSPHYRNVDLVSRILQASLARPTAVSHFLLHPSLYLLDLMSALVRFLPLCSPAADEWLKATAGVMLLVVACFRVGVEDLKGDGVRKMREEGIQ